MPPAIIKPTKKGSKHRYDWKSEEHIMHMCGPSLLCESSSPLVVGLRFPRSNVDSEEEEKGAEADWGTVGLWP